MKNLITFELFENNNGVGGELTLFYAVMNKNYDTIKDIIKNKKEILNYPDPQDFTPLAIAAYNHDMKSIRLLIDADADWLKKTEFNKTFFEMLTVAEQDIIKLEYPLKYQKYIKRQKSNMFNL
jgi:ankyrin repeat protein